MKVEPNSEQKPAIYHEGGVLLKAGAGSGKTFVLTFHLVHLVNLHIEKFIKMNGPKSEDDFRAYIRTVLSKFVLMTFTNKAAGEISTRIVKRFQEASENLVFEGLSFDPWQIVSDSFDRLFVGTIHGFCFKLIKDGVIPSLDSSSKFISEAEFNDSIDKLFENWLEKNLENYSQFEELILNEKNKIISSLKSILSDPALRIQWKKLDVGLLNKKSSDEAVTFILEQKLDRDISKLDVDYSSIPSKYDGKPWLELLKAFEKIRFENFKTFEGFVKIIKFFEPWHLEKGLRKPSAKDVPEEIKEFYEEVKSIKDICKDYQEDFLNFDTHFDSHVKPWLSVLKNIVVDIESEYERLGVLTFSDLEYNVWLALQDKNVRLEIQKNHSYYIIDEFQDTSFIQYEIIQNLIENDFNKLFCVGDAKQAIYGFRGGEIGVFTDCETKVPKPMSMTNNFRSLGNVINFNNTFFDYLFKLGKKFEGVDNHTVVVEHQTIPSGKENQGLVSKVKVDLEKINLGEEGTSLNSRVIEYIEALALVEKIKELKENSPDDTIAILYSKLKASDIMVSLLMQENIGFTAQVKVPFGEDPLVGIFFTMISHEFNQNLMRDHFRDFLVSSYLGLLNLEVPLNLEEIFLKFEKNSQFFGMKDALKIFFFELGVSNSNFENNFKKLEVIIDLCRADKNKIYRTLKIDASNRYSIDFQYGKEARKLQIMTAHASKGLEFNHVLCAGIYTNGTSLNLYPEIGNMPGAFQWSLETKKGNRFKTPTLLFERLLQKEKEFSEAKRLFYVVGTRAEESLTWVDIDFSHYKTRISSDSWINGIKAFFDDVSSENLSLSRQVEESSKSVDISSKVKLELLDYLEHKVPLFHVDNLGLEVKTNEKANLALIPEMAITKLATIVDCPRKFYLKNILKLEEEKSQEYVKNESMDYSSFEEAPVLKNSSARGTEIHEEISRIILSDFTDIASNQVVNETVEKLKNYRDKFELHSEKEIKFELFHFMVTGIPDLYLLPKEKTETAEIWDFKTGRGSESKDKKYFFQLTAYAYALYKKEHLSLDQKIKMLIYYVDERKEVEKTVSFKDVENFLWTYWLEINRPDLCNTEHCKVCSYGNICHAGRQ